MSSVSSSELRIPAKTMRYYVKVLSFCCLALWMLSSASVSGQQGGFCSPQTSPPFYCGLTCPRIVIPQPDYRCGAVYGIFCYQRYVTPCALKTAMCNDPRIQEVPCGSGIAYLISRLFGGASPQ